MPTVPYTAEQFVEILSQTAQMQSTYESVLTDLQNAQEAIGGAVTQLQGVIG